MIDTEILELPFDFDLKKKASNPKERLNQLLLRKFGVNYVFTLDDGSEVSIQKVLRNPVLVSRIAHQLIDK